MPGHSTKRMMEHPITVHASPPTPHAHPFDR